MSIYDSFTSRITTAHYDEYNQGSTYSEIMQILCSDKFPIKRHGQVYVVHIPKYLGKLSNDTDQNKVARIHYVLDNLRQ